MAHLFRIWHKLAPKYLLSNINAVSDAHTNNTRGSTYNFHLSRELSRFSDGFAFTAIRQWNDLPYSIKSISGFQVFKRKLKDHLLSQYGWFLTDIFDRFLRSWNSFDSRSFEFLTFYEFTFKGTLLEKSWLRLSQAIPRGKQLYNLFCNYLVS